MSIDPIMMVFDVESVGLHGEGFAVGWVVIDPTGAELSSGQHWCDPDKAAGVQSDREWINNNVALRRPADYTCLEPRLVRGEFWIAYKKARAEGASLWAECAWPVEANFLSQMVADRPLDRRGPYPLHEIATARLLAGFDPLATCERLPDELPVHNPLADARQSARLLVEALRVLRGEHARPSS